ncbi:conserved hypothetical protein [uncultured Eubacteriales bacterium]|uniref:Phospholipase C/D domain-containing protein n=1 Tax=uncultured Eubacteriales bacterium TaxID=172733 RepID=A0A212J205_9FIRM|nr:conserved hypothetical protein [uncultured Eubacteriales bacterium]
MPESYFHVRCARRAYQKCGARGYDIPSVIAGSAGPDILFYYIGLPPLTFLGQRMHRERCGPFLTALVRRADSLTLRSYVLGFLSHNAADTTLHPWVKRSGLPHAAAESALDSFCLLRDSGRGIVEAADSAARLTREKRLEIGGLLSEAIREVYGVRVSRGALAGAIEDFRRCRGWLRDPKRRKARLAGGAERLLRLEAGTLAGHLTPGGPLDATEELEEQMAQAEDLAAELMSAAQSWWAGELGPLELERRIGDRPYNGENRI